VDNSRIDNDLKPEIILPFSEPRPELILAVQAALLAGQKILQMYSTNYDSHQKKDHSWVTDADIASEQILLKILSETGYPILSEESKDNKARLGQEYLWIIDPLDGTADFIEKTGDFSIMIGLVQGHEPILGVVYQPTEKAIYLAQKNKGTYVHRNNQWRKLSVSQFSELSQSRATVSRHHLTGAEKKFLTDLHLAYFTDKGSAGLKIAEVAAGRAELYLTSAQIKHWDTCAGSCLVKEAGGKITDTQGNEFSYNQDSVTHTLGVLVTNGRIHQKVVEVYGKFKWS